MQEWIKEGEKRIGKQIKTQFPNILGGVRGLCRILNPDALRTKKDPPSRTLSALKRPKPNSPQKKMQITV